MENSQRIFNYTIELLLQRSIKHEYTHFPSGAIMLDIWHNDKFYVIQFEDFIGISEVNDDTPIFDTIPDEKFENEAAYKERLEKLFI